eukprot:2196254-Rhodomonas_salina.1
MLRPDSAINKIRIQLGQIPGLEWLLPKEVEDDEKNKYTGERVDSMIQSPTNADQRLLLGGGLPPGADGGAGVSVPSQNGFGWDAHNGAPYFNGAFNKGPHGIGNAQYVNGNLVHFGANGWGGSNGMWPPAQPNGFGGFNNAQPNGFGGYNSFSSYGGSVPMQGPDPNMWGNGNLGWVPPFSG